MKHKFDIFVCEYFWNCLGREVLARVKKKNLKAKVDLTYLHVINDQCGTNQICQEENDI